MHKKTCNMCIIAHTSYVRSNISFCVFVSYSLKTLFSHHAVTEYKRRLICIFHFFTKKYRYTLYNIYILLYHRKQQVREVHLKQTFYYIGDTCNPKSQGANQTSSGMAHWQEFSFFILIQIMFSPNIIVNFKYNLWNINFHLLGKLSW